MGVMSHGVRVARMVRAGDSRWMRNGRRSVAPGLFHANRMVNAATMLAAVLYLLFLLFCGVLLSSFLVISVLVISLAGRWRASRSPAAPGGSTLHSCIRLRTHGQVNRAHVSQAQNEIDSSCSNGGSPGCS